MGNLPEINELGGVAVRHGRADLSEVSLHYVEAGEGPLVVLLHGFPEFWYSWRHQIPALVEAGYRVVAPDMRGYNTSDKPSDVHDYRLDVLAGDVAGLVRERGEESCLLAAHDWGAVVAWHFAQRHSDMLGRLVIMNVPHPLSMLRWLKTPKQLMKSWYIFFFQLPGIPEAALRAFDFAAIRRVFREDPVREDAFSEEEIERYVQAMKRPGALTAMIHYYRAIGRNPTRPRDLSKIEKPVLVIWGEQDMALRKEMAEPPEDLVPDARVERLPDASHWVQVDRPERVNELMLAFFENTSH